MELRSASRNGVMNFNKIGGAHLFGQSLVIPAGFGHQFCHSVSAVVVNERFDEVPRSQPKHDIIASIELI